MSNTFLITSPTLSSLLLSQFSYVQRRRTYPFRVLATRTTNDDDNKNRSKSHRERLWSRHEYSGGEYVKSTSLYWEQWTEKRIQQVLDLEYEVDASDRVEELLRQGEGGAVLGQEQEAVWDVNDQKLLQNQIQSQQDYELLRQEVQGYEGSSPIPDQQFSQQHFSTLLAKDKVVDDVHTLQNKRKLNKKKQRNKKQLDDIELQGPLKFVRSRNVQVKQDDRRKIRREQSVRESAASVGAYLGIEQGAVVYHAARQGRFDSSCASQLASLPPPLLNSKRYEQKRREKKYSSAQILLRYSSQQPKLSTDQKAELAALAQQGVKIERVRRDLKNELRRDSSVVELAVALGWSVDVVKERIVDGRRAREVLIRSHLQMVVTIAYKYVPKVDMTLEDLVSEGLIGLNVGIEKHDMKRGSSVTTTMYIYARNAMWLAITSEDKVVCIPKSAQEQAVKVQKTLRKYPNAKVKEIAKLAKLREASVKRALTNLQIQEQMLSQTVKLQGKNSRQVTLEESLEYIQSTKKEDQFPLQEKEISALQLLNILDDNERDIVVRLYGLSTTGQTNEPTTVSQLARDLNIDRQRLRKKVLSIFEKLRQSRDFDDLVEFQFDAL